MTIVNNVPALLVILWLVFGSAFLGVKVAVQTVPPLLLAGARFLIADAVLFAIARRASTVGGPIGRGEWSAALVTSGAMILMGQGSVVWSSQYLVSGTVALIASSVPIWVAVLGYAFERRRLAPLEILGILAGFGGLVLLIAPSGSSAHHLDVRAAGAILIGAVAWAGGTLYARTASMPKEPLLATAMQMLCGGALLTVVSLLSGDASRIAGHAISTASLAAFVYLTVVCSMIGFTIFTRLLHLGGAALPNTFAYVAPVVAMVLSALVLHEPLTSRTIVAMAIVVAGVALMLIKPRPRPSAAPAQQP